ncbi:hypothetical protein Zmor_026778 [Zophobas morio]|uniref:Uncharacterized protein n=1 Tax=Zophobas morio TaxID=2755281 RepID=A0AA38M4U4_9CUCU|nr:hypothetical protein Zmor_026778 [Zophobas morio]
MAITPDITGGGGRVARNLRRINIQMKQATFANHPDAVGVPTLTPRITPSRPIIKWYRGGGGGRHARTANRLHSSTLLMSNRRIWPGSKQKYENSNAARRGSNGNGMEAFHGAGNKTNFE